MTELLSTWGGPSALAALLLHIWRSATWFNQIESRGEINARDIREHGEQLKALAKNDARFAVLETRMETIFETLVRIESNMPAPRPRRRSTPA